MTNIAAILKSEMVRLSRKTLKQDLTGIRTALTLQRKQISTLKSQVSELAMALSRLQKNAAKAAPSNAFSDDDTASARFSAKGLRSHRSKLGLSAQGYAKLAGVSALSIYKWESEKAYPRRAQVEALAGLRTLGKRAAHAKLAELQAGD